MIEQDKTKKRSLAWINIIKLSVFGAGIFVLSFAIISMTMLVGDARENKERTIYGISKPLGYLATGIFPFFGSIFLGDDRFSLKEMPSAADPFPLGTVMPEVKEEKNKPVSPKKDHLGPIAFGIVISAIHAYLGFSLFAWGWILVMTRNFLEKFKISRGPLRSFLAAWVLSSLLLALVGFVASLL